MKKYRFACQYCGRRVIGMPHHLEANRYGCLDRHRLFLSGQVQDMIKKIKQGNFEKGASQ